MKPITRIVSLASLCCALFLTAQGCDDTATSEPQLVNPSVGVHYFIVDGPGGRDLSTAIWYPAPEGTEGEPFVYSGFLSREAIQDAPIHEGGPWPLVVFSHGHEGVKEQSIFFTETLAKAGYIVVAPDHVGNTFFIQDHDLDPILNHLRPLDVTAVLDRIESPSEDDPDYFTTAIDMAHVAVAGHSRGGYTAVVSSGASVDVPQYYTDYCATHAEEALCVDFPGTDAQHALGDARIDASIPISPANYEAFVSGGLGDVQIPSLVITGRLDQSTPVEGTVEPIYEGLPAPKYFWILEEADHFTFSDLCNVYHLLDEETQAGFGVACDPDNALSLDDAHTLTMEAVLNFLDWNLKGDMDGKTRLEAMGNDQITLTFDAP